MAALVPNKLLVISLGGSLISPKEGLDPIFLKSFKDLIVTFIKKGYRFIIVTGGGNTAREYQAAAKELGKLESDDIDWIGIHATRLNAHLLRTIFRAFAYRVVVKNPTKKVGWGKQKILIGAGWKPGWSTDYVSVKLAEAYGAKVVINMSNIDYVYSQDPRANPEAEKIKKITWADFRKIVGNKWMPGGNFPFDPVAARAAERLHLIVKFVKGTNLVAVAQAVEGQVHSGTIIA